MSLLEGWGADTTGVRRENTHSNLFNRIWELIPRLDSPDVFSKLLVLNNVSCGEEGATGRGCVRVV